MRPRVFVGSSTERLDIAYAIQENLDHDAQITVWTQGIFKLSTSSLDSLVAAIDKFDFAIFVFHPDDVTQIRTNSFDTVRDNLIFELGLFMGKLGKEKVFFLIPRTVQKLHLPTDLLGITPGTYDNTREDGNLHASLAPFCNQIRTLLKNFVYEDIEDIQGEPQFIKTIVIERKEGWEYLFAAEMLGLKLAEINKSYDEIESNSSILKLKSMTGQEFFGWFQEMTANMKVFIDHFAKCVNELTLSFGQPGVAGKPIEIKNAVERFAMLCKELLSMEYDLYSINPPAELLSVKKDLKGWTKLAFINEINRMQNHMKQTILDIRSGKEVNTKHTLTLTLIFPEVIAEAVEEFRRYLKL